MKKLTTISLFIFGVIVTAVLVAGLVFYQDKKINVVSDSQPTYLPIVINPNNAISTTKEIKSNPKNTSPSTPTTPTITTPVITIPPVVTPNTMTLNMTEIAKHNSRSDCWMLIGGKVYEITEYFGSHPGGNSTMASTCGTDATSAYATQDPNATGSSSRSAHSGKARSLLNNYYIGDFNQTISL